MKFAVKHAIRSGELSTFNSGIELPTPYLGKIVALKLLESATEFIVFLKPRNQLAFRDASTRISDSNFRTQYLGIIGQLRSFKDSLLETLVRGLVPYF